MNRGPHTCQSGLKVGRMKQNKGSFTAFQQKNDYKTHHYLQLHWIIWPKNCNTVISGFIISLIQLILL